jgi:prepilin-type N-terminal cleavage/methylation domain-containing protein
MDTTMNDLRRRSSHGQRGFSLSELLVVVAIIGVLSVLATPFFIRYLRSAVVQGAASEVATMLNQGRQLAIARNQSVCVRINGATVRYELGGCGTANYYLGAGTDSSGYMRLTDNVTLTTTADPVFTSLGAAAPAATYTVTHSQYPTITMTVTVAGSGRVRVGP